MILKSFFILFSLIFSQSLFAQELKTFKVNPGEKVYDVISPKDRYAYPDFISGYRSVQERSNRGKPDEL